MMPLPPVRARIAAAAPHLAFLAVTLAVFLGPFLRGDYPARPDVLTRAWPWRQVAPGPAPESPVGMSDPVTYFYPANRYYAEAVRGGDLPFWNPQLLCGYPALATGQIGAFYPPKWLLFRWLDLPRAMTLHLALHFWGAGAAMAFLLRTRGVGPAGACAGGLTWMLCEANAFFLQFDALAVASVWGPLAIALAARAFERRSAWWACAGGLAFGLGLLGGYFQRMYYAALIIALWGMVEGVRGVWRRPASAPAETPARRRSALDVLRAAFGPPGLAAVTLGLGAAVGAAAVAPFLDILADPIREAVPYGALFPSPLRRAACLVTLAAPRLLGGDLDWLELWPRAGTTFREFTAYVGVLPLALGLLAAVGARRREAAAFTLLAAAGLLLVLGTPLTRLAYAFVPGFDRAEPTRLFWVWALGAAALAGIGADALVREPQAPVWRKLSCGLGGAALLLAAAGGAATVAGLAGMTATPVRWADLRNPAIAGGVLGLAGAAAVSAAARRLAGSAALPAAACVVIALDLLALSVPMNPSAAPDRLYPETPAIAHVRREFRQAAEPFRTVARRELDWWGWHVANALLPYGLDTPEGHEAMRPAAYTRFVGALGAARDSSGPLYGRDVHFGALDGPGAARLLDFLGVRYVFADPGKTLPLAGWRTHAFPDAVLYENPAPGPRAFLVASDRATVVYSAEEALERVADPAFDLRKDVVLEGPAGTLLAMTQRPLRSGRAAYARPDPASVAVEVWADGPGYVVIPDAYDPGWEAARNGRPCRVLRADGAFRAVEIPGAGAWRIEMRYRPRWWPWAFYVSLASGLGAALGWGLAVRRDKLPLPTSNSRQ